MLVTFKAGLRFWGTSECHGISLFYSGTPFLCWHHFIPQRPPFISIYHSSHAYWSTDHVPWGFLLVVVSSDEEAKDASRTQNFRLFIVAWSWLFAVAKRCRGCPWISPGRVHWTRTTSSTRRPRQRSEESTLLIAHSKALICRSLCAVSINQNKSQTCKIKWVIWRGVTKTSGVIRWILVLAANGVICRRLWPWDNMYQNSMIVLNNHLY